MQINWHTLFFLLTALVTCVFALAVVLTNNIVRMAFYLVISLAAVAGLFFLAGADFVAATQLMVYVGGTLVLLVFGVMLTGRAARLSMRIDLGQWAMAAIAGGALLVILVQAAFSVHDWRGRTVEAAGSAASNAAVPTAAPIGMGLLGVRTDQLQQADPVLKQGMSGYLLAFEIISIHLVVVLVGAAYLARAWKRPNNPAADLSEQRHVSV